MEHMGMGFGLGFLNLIGTILFWVAAFWTVRFFIRGGFRGDYRSRLPKWRGEWSKGRGGGRPWENRSGPGDEAEKMMRERLAKGEISEDEYAKLKAHLGSGNESNGGEGNHGSPRAESGPLGWLKGDGALELARMRFAKGEIGADEFETIRRVLTS